MSLASEEGRGSPWLAAGQVPSAGTHGGDGPAVARALGLPPEALLDLSQTLNPFGPDVAGLLARRLDEIGRYPDPSAATTCLAEAVGVERERLLVTNGGSEAIALVAAELGGHPLSEPDFALYPRDQTGAVWRSNPHSPSGLLASPELTADVWDEAFYPMATGRWTAGRDGVVVGSLTKVFACPGLRLGYLIADDVERFARHQARWSVASPSLAVVPDLLARADLSGWRVRIAEIRLVLAEMFASRGFDVRAADAPWILVDGPGLRERLAPHGVLVRDCTSFGMPGWVRVAVPGDDDLARVDDALAGADDVPTRVDDALTRADDALAGADEAPVPVDGVGRRTRGGATVPPS